MMVTSMKMKMMNISPLMLFAWIVAFVNANSEELMIEKNPLSYNNDTKVDINRNLIVGGEESEVLGFPYFVQTLQGGCGGVLIANEWVLTAAHCGDLTGEQVLISAFKYFDNTGGFGSRVRACVTYIEESKFRCRAEVGDGRICDRNNINNESPFKQDYALCKLNLPVYVDDENVKLELNFDSDFPSTGDDVIAIGFGSTRLGGPQTEFIRDVTLSVNSNRECRNADSKIYNPNSIGSESICASDPEGGKDTCRGDSGGPLITRTFNALETKSVHSHVGITSWGDNCGEQGSPGVYARTSAGRDFIKGTICNDFQSKSPFCQTPVTCNVNDSETKLTIKVRPDNFPEETVLIVRDITGGVGDETLLEVGTTAENRRSSDIYRFFTYEESLCLRPGRDYLFEIFDRAQDGFLSTINGDEQYLGFYSLILNDTEEVKTSRGRNFFSGEEFQFTTPPKLEVPVGMSCVDAAKNVVVFQKKKKKKKKKGRIKNKNCANFLKGKRKRKIKKRCKKKFNEVKVQDVCPLSCGKKAGVGKCSSLFEKN